MRSGKLRKTSPVISPVEAAADPVVATSDDEDDAPESVGFAESKATALAELQSARDQIQSVQGAKKAARKRKLEKFKAQKEEKQKKELEKRQNELPLDILESLVPKTSEPVKPNQIKKFADNDQDKDFEGLNLEDDDDDDALAPGRSFKVVSKKDQSNLASHVPQDIINFRANMLNNPRIKRESAEDLMNRRKKMKQIGCWNNKKPIRNK